MIWVSLIMDWINIFGDNFKNPQEDVTRILNVKYRSR